MVRRPVLDDNDKADILERTRELAPHYVDGWDVEEDDAGTALLEIFAEMGEEITERLNQTPVKHRVMFLDMLDFTPNPPQPATVPVTFEIAENSPANVVIPDGTTVEAVETERRPSQRFETTGAEFEGTPARITDVFAVDPGIDRIVPHHELIGSDGSVRLFEGTNVQAHALYLGDPDLLDVEPGATIELAIRTNAPAEAIRSFLTWEFYGETEDGEEGWHPLVVHGQRRSEVPEVSELAQVRSLVDKLELVLPHESYTRLEGPREETLLQVLADDVRNGQFDATGRPEDADCGLPTALIDARELDDETCHKIARHLDQLRYRLNQMADGVEFGAEFETVTVEVTVPGEPEPGAVSGVGSFWIRARFPDDDLSHAMFNTLVESVTATVRPATGGEGDDDPDTGDADDDDGDGPGSTESADAPAGGDRLEAEEGIEVDEVGPDAGGSPDPSESAGEDGSDERDPGPTETHLDALVANGTQLDPAGEVDVPLLGSIPIVGLSAEFSCDEAFEEPGTAVELRFERDDEGEAGADSDTDAKPDGADTLADEEGEPRLVWEYAAEAGWKPLSVDDGTDSLRESGTVRFTVPDDTTVDTVNSWTGHWIRVRLVDGDYGQPRFEEVEDSNWQQVTDHIEAPKYDTISVSYDPPEPQSESEVDGAVDAEPETVTDPDDSAVTDDSPDPMAQTSEQADTGSMTEPREFTHLVAENNLTLSHIESRDEPFSPFESPPTATQTLYLGFGRALEGGPLNFYVSIAESIYPRSFDPLLDVEYCANVHTREWQRTGISDGTDDLTVRGILSLTLPEPTTEVELFGKTRHWLRLTMTGDNFARTEESLFVPDSAVKESVRIREVLSYQSLATREEQSHTRLPPTVDGIYPNTQWATNVTSVQSEVVGSSDGTASQKFELPDAPALSVDVWVDESDALSDRLAQELIDDRSTTVVDVYDADGHLSELWVEWSEVTDFIGSGPESRQFVLNETEGTVRFGDGKEGAIPPEGENNIRADYETGGGDDGNKQAGTVETLIDPIQHVKGVTNHEPGKAGEPAEPLAEFVKRAPKNLRDRGKPITRDGFVRITKAISREIDRVRCIAGEDETDTPGRVILVIVPDVAQRKPIPSEELVHRVEREMERRVPAAVVSGDRSNLTIRGPKYVEASVTATITTSGSRSATTVTDRAISELTDFAHPLTGGPEGDGWAIGTLPEPSLFAANLEKLDSVGHVRDLAVTYREGDRQLTVALGEDSPDVSPDILVYSGRHTVTVDVGGDR